MTILSWNILFDNKRLDEVLAALTESGADIICLQEVSDPFLARLRTLPYYLAEALEIARHNRKGISQAYVVTLARYPIKDTRRVRLPRREAAWPLRTRVFVGLMVSLGLWGRGFGERNQLITTVETPQGTVEVMNLHLPLHRLEWRQEEFELAMRRRKHAVASIICGDFNTLESRRIAPLHWLLGGTLRAMFFWREERREMESRFATHKLSNPLRGNITHPLSKSQLDHILVSQDFEVIAARVLPQRYGSDHAPIQVVVRDAFDKR